jgi:uncharacterized protein YecE (DUF72 family)
MVAGPGSVARAWIGCSGWNYRHWRGLFYPSELPASRWLEHYAETFDTVEVNATFYRLPSRKTATAWAQATPPGFLFAVKASRYLTHVKRLRDVGHGIERLLEPLEPIRETGKLGPLLWQLPETFHRDDERLSRALVPEVEQLLRAHHVALVIADHPARPFQTLGRTASWTYVRLHLGRGRDGAYEDAALELWARRIREWQAHGDVLAYFNDDWAGHAPVEALQLRTLVAQEV